MSYEDILKAVGGFGRYQKLLTLLLVVSGIPNGYLVLTIVFVGMTPPHRCCVPGIEECLRNSSGPTPNYDLPKATWEAHIPHHDIDGVKYSQCGMISTDSNTTKQCTNGWVFDIDSDRTTFVTEWELVCDRSLYRPLLTALFMAGVMCGSTLSGFLSDRLIDESPSWLLSKGKFEEFWKLVRKIAKSNGVPEENVDELRACWKKEENKETAESWSDLFRHFKHRRVFATLLNKCFTWFSCSVAYYVLSLNTSNFGGSPYINCFLAAAVEIPAYAIVILALKKIGRKSFVFGSLVCTGVFCGAVPYIDIVSTKGAIASAMIGKLCVAACFSVIYLYCAELFPTPIRTTAVGLCSMSARVGAIVAPYLLYAGETYSSLPYLIIFGLSFLSAFFILWLPETCLATLPESKNDMLRLKLNLKEIFKIHKIIGKGSENNNDANEDQKSVTEPLSVGVVA
uniref:solute carrier family 22 member 21-like isoform X2 n=1 Tax=Ciona intestinalis TaxID=7719 RepID=UPI000EF477E8|nr:solute carrier family 22 member 21-like isoform X2 [Ciona intestinalis]|eukprot:XP_026692288.1 solute carrier family 22 member 21-like isoform X2 [Ciona intestinalis]